MEGFGLAVGLFGLFKTVVDCFDYIQVAKHYPFTFQLALARLDIEKDRLLIWASSTGLHISNADPGGHAIVWEPKSQEKIENLLKLIFQLLSDSENLKSRYGLQEVGALDEPIHEPRPLLSSKRFQKLLAKLPRSKSSANSGQNPNVFRRRIWALQDCEKFEMLIERLRELVDGLQVYSLDAKLENQMMTTDIASIKSISELQLIEVACEQTYPNWADAATEQIAASRIGESDGDDGVNDWTSTLPDVVATDTDTVSEADCSLFVVPQSDISLHSKVFFVLIPSCNLNNEEACIVHTRIEDHVSVQGYDNRSSPWTLTRKLTDVMDPSDFKPESSTLDESFLYNGIGFWGIIANVYIYCAPCIRLINTALSICTSGGHCPYFQYRIQIDSIVY
ncbi:MAG: hypothetical protein Q9159_006179 [Coniocarpon cinnabarinum]